MPASISPTPLSPSPDRVAAGDKAFVPTNHLWVDGVWWSPDGRYRWTGDAWVEPPTDAEVQAEQAAERTLTARRLTRSELGYAIGAIAWGGTVALCFANVRVANHQLVAASDLLVAAAVLIPLLGGLVGCVGGFFYFRTAGDALDVAMTVVFMPVRYFLTAVFQGGWGRTGMPKLVPAPGTDPLPDDVAEDLLPH